MLTNKTIARAGGAGAGGVSGGADELMSRFAIPFAKALAVFLREAGIDHRASGSETAGTRPEEFTELNDRLLIEALATRMRRLMRERRISQADLAARAGVSVGVVSRALKDPNRAKLSTLRSMATALDARFTELF